MAPTLALLEQIHQTHSETWPFENFDVFLSGRNGLDRAALGAKLEAKTRGGWCFELNEWLALALEDAGFAVRRLLARNLYAPGRPRTHQITLVSVGAEAWVADTSFGAQSPRRPMRLEDGFERDHDGLPFRLEFRPPTGTGPFADPGIWVLRYRADGAWRDHYGFTLETAQPADFAVGNHFHLTNPTSSFADSRFVSRSVPGGRLTLVDRTLKTWRNTCDGERLEAETPVATRAAYGELLAASFGLALPGPAIDRLWNLEPSVSRGSEPL